MKILKQTPYFQFFDTNRINNSNGENAYPTCDGCVWMEVYEQENGIWYFFLYPFAKDGPKFKPGSTEEEQKNNRANIWKWDGNRNNPTITPSFLCEDRGVRVHITISNGQINLCGDSNVVLGEVPKVDLESDGP